MPMGRADQAASSVFTRQPKTWRRWHCSKDNRGSEGTANGLGYKRKDRLCSVREPGDGSRRRVDPGGGGLPRRCGCAQSGAHRPCGGENSIGRRNGDWDISRSFHDCWNNCRGDRKSTRMNSSHTCASRMPSSARKKKQDKTRQLTITQTRQTVK